MSLDQAMTHYEAGNRAAARAAAEACMETSPHNGDALNLLAVIAQDEGRQADAETFARRAVALAPAHPLYLNTLGNGLMAQGRGMEAVAVLEAAHKALPEQPDILFNLGNAQRQAGLLDAAVQSFRLTSELRPGHIGAFNNLALLLKSIGDVETAATVLIEAVAHAPQSAELRFNLANTLHAAGRLPPAEAAYRKAIALDPDHAEAHANLGAVLAEAGLRDKAEASFHAAIAINPDTVSAYMGLADLAGDDPAAGVARRRTHVDLRPDLAPIRSSFLMSLHHVAGISRDEIFAEHKAFGVRTARAEAPVFSPAHDFSPQRRLKVGFVSGDFRFHALLFFALPVIENRDTSAFEIYLYSATVKTDPYTPDFRAAADHWRDVRTLSPDELARLVVSDGIDILIDLSGHTPNNRLPAFAFKPAPLQVAWGDYADTRGLTTIDVLLGDAVHTPPDDDRYFTERVVRLAPGYVAYAPPSYAPPVADAPCLINGYVIFGTFSDATKVGPAAVAQWAAVLKAVPSSKFLLNGFLFADGARQGRIVSMFVEAGIAADRLIFKDGELPGASLAQYADVDIVLDTAPYSGSLATCEALLMGVPVLTVMGDRFCGRHAAAHLMNGAYPEGVCATLSDLIKKAQALAEDPQGLGKRRHLLRGTFIKSPLCDVTGYSAAFYAMLRKEWAMRCAPRYGTSGAGRGHGAELAVGDRQHRQT